MSEGKLIILSGNAHIELSKRICGACGITSSRVRVGHFPDGETDIRIEDDVRGGDVFIIQSTCTPVNQNLMELLILIDCVKRASAGRITAVIPYFGYARQDRKDVSRVPITAKLVANMLTHAGADRVLTVDLHAAQIQGFFDIPLDHLYAKPVLGKYFEEKHLENLVTVAPDVGSLKMARAYSKQLHTGLAIIDKRRVTADTTAVTTMIGEVQGKTVLLIDDMISTASTMSEAAKFCKEKGAVEIYVAATHGVFCGKADLNLSIEEISEVVVTDTIPIITEKLSDPFKHKLKVLPIADLLGRAILNIHDSRSVSSLFV